MFQEKIISNIIDHVDLGSTIGPILFSITTISFLYFYSYSLFSLPFFPPSISPSSSSHSLSENEKVTSEKLEVKEEKEKVHVMEDQNVPGISPLDILDADIDFLYEKVNKILDLLLMEDDFLFTEHIENLIEAFDLLLPFFALLDGDTGTVFNCPDFLSRSPQIISGFTKINIKFKSVWALFEGLIKGISVITKNKPSRERLHSVIEDFYIQLQPYHNMEPFSVIDTPKKFYDHYRSTCSDYVANIPATWKERIYRSWHNFGGRSPTPTKAFTLSCVLSILLCRSLYATMDNIVKLLDIIIKVNGG